MINVYFNLVIIFERIYPLCYKFACLVQNNSLIRKSQGKKYSAVTCRCESGKNQTTSAFTSTIADCRCELKRLHIHLGLKQPFRGLLDVWKENWASKLLGKWFQM